MSTPRVIGWIVSVILLFLWAQTILGVAVFVIPDRYSAPESLAFSAITVGIGVAVPAAAVWLLKLLTASGSRELTRVESDGTGPASDALTAAQAEVGTRPVTAGVEPTGFVEALSERELEILRHVALGKSNKDIANELVISVGTVKTHTNNLYRKLGARNRTEAVALARHLELL